MFRAAILSVVLLAVLPRTSAVPLLAQEPPDTPPPVQTIDTASPGPTPRGAFLRAAAFPAWGHVYIDEPVRGGVFFTLQSTSYFMLFKTLARLAEAEERRDVAAGIAADSLQRIMATDSVLADRLADPVAFEDAVAASDRVQTRQDLVDSRQRQRQDWLVYTATFTFASAVDAYVAAHLKGFPDLDVMPAANGAVRLRVRLPTGRRR